MIAIVDYQMGNLRSVQKAVQRVGHAFADPSRSNYNADVAEDAWRRTVVFLSENLASADES